MSEALERRAEIAKLARLLGRTTDQLPALAEIPAGDLRELREQVTETLFSAGAAPLHRLAAASKLLPAGLVATLAERVFGPVLSARIATLIEPDRAVQMAAKLPTAFVAEIACELDPRRAHEVIARIPAQQVAEVSELLVARGEFVTMGRFVGHLDPAATKAAVAVMDEHCLLQVAFVLESKDSFGDVFDLLSDERLRGLIETASAEGVWAETLDLLTNLADDQREHVIEIAAGCEDAVLDSLIEAADASSVWDLVLPLTKLMDEATLRRFARLRALQRKGVLERVVDAAAEHEELWANLVPMASQLPPRCRARVIARASALGALARLGELGQALSA